MVLSIIDVYGPIIDCRFRTNAAHYLQVKCKYDIQF